MCHVPENGKQSLRQLHSSRLNTLPIDASTQSASKPDILHSFPTKKCISNHQFLATTLLCNKTGRSAVRRPNHRHTNGNGVRRSDLSASLPTFAVFSSIAQSRRSETRGLAAPVRTSRRATDPSDDDRSRVLSRVARD